MRAWKGSFRCVCVLHTTDVGATSGCSKAVGHPSHADSRGAASSQPAHLPKFCKRYQHTNILSRLIASQTFPLDLDFLEHPFFPLHLPTPAGSENGSNGEANFTSAQREVVCGCINSWDIHPCNQKLERSNDLGVRWHGNLSKAQHLSAITHEVPVAYLHTAQMHNPDVMPRHYAVRARVTVVLFEAFTGHSVKQLNILKCNF